ncbi:hypothetical protein ABK040_014120 [Willaertia magna]
MSETWIRTQAPVQEQISLPIENVQSLDYSQGKTQLIGNVEPIQSDPNYTKEEEVKSTLQTTSHVFDDSLETLPLRAAKRIVQYIHQQVQNNPQLTSQKKRNLIEIITEDRVLKELEKVLGKDYVSLCEEIVNLGNRIAMNKKMDEEYSDKPEPIVLTHQVKRLYGGELSDKEKTVKNGSKHEKEKQLKRFDLSKQAHELKLREQQELSQLFKPLKKKIDKHDYEDRDPIRLVYEEEKPSEKEIESYRGDRNEELTDEERALQQAVNYMVKFKDYFKYIQDIQYLKHIPSKSARAMMIENFQKYLMDAKYYIHFYHKYSYYWAPESTRTIEPYRGLFVPVEKRKEEDTYHFDQSIATYEPLRTMIYQDFHDRVRKGLPPSLDLDGKLPTLAMHYARTTFVPPMTREQMQSLYFPLNDLNNRREIQVPKFIPNMEKPSFDFVLNDFQTKYFTRKHLLSHLHRSFIVNYDSSSQRYLSITGEELINNLSKLIYLLGYLNNNDENKFPQYFHCIGLFHNLNNQTDFSLEYILLMCFSLFMGIPFITFNESITNIDEALKKIETYCKMPFIATSDHQLIAQTLKFNHHQVKNVLYYGRNEPYCINRSLKGSSVNEDPISNILQPVNLNNMKNTEEQVALWNYLPDNSETDIEILHYKNLMSSSKGLSSYRMENIRKQATERLKGWKINDRKQLDNNSDLLFMSLDENSSTLKGIPYNLFKSNLDSISEHLQSLIDTIKQKKNLEKRKENEKQVQVVICMNVTHPMVPLLLTLCLEHGLSFSFVSPSIYSHGDISQLLNTLNSLCPSIIIADTHLTIELTKIFENQYIIRDSKYQNNFTTVVDKKNVLDLTIEYKGILHDWTASNILKNLQKQIKKQTTSQESIVFLKNLKGIISYGNVLGDECSSSLIKYVPHAYQLVFSKELQFPLFIRNLKEEDNKEGVKVLSPWSLKDSFVESEEVVVYGPSVPTSLTPKQIDRRKEEFILLDLENKVFNHLDREENLEDNNTYYMDLIDKYNKVEMPNNVREPLTNCLQLREEYKFYYQVKKLIEKHEDKSKPVISLSFFDNCLYSVLLDELETITPKHYQSIELKDVIKFLELRLQLTIESIKLVLFDFRYKFSNAMKEGKIKFNFKEKEQGPQFNFDIGKKEKVHTNLVWLQNNFTNRVLVLPRSQDQVLFNRCLLECLYEYYLPYLFCRCFITILSDRDLKPVPILIVFSNHHCGKNWDESINQIGASIERLKKEEQQEKRHWTLFTKKQTISQDKQTKSIHNLIFKKENVLIVNSRNNLNIFNVYSEFNDELMLGLFANRIKHGAKAVAHSLRISKL